MYGAILGDMIGSPYEFDQGEKIKDFGPLFINRSCFTDDSVMTIAVAEALMDAGLDAGEKLTAIVDGPDEEAAIEGIDNYLSGR